MDLNSDNSQHFGQLVKKVIDLKVISLLDAASYAEISLEKLKMMLVRDEWTNLEIKQFSMALMYDFGKHLSPWEIDVNAFPNHQDCNFYISYNVATDADKIKKLNITVRKLCGEIGLNCD